MGKKNRSRSGRKILSANRELVAVEKPDTIENFIEKQPVWRTNLINFIRLLLLNSAFGMFSIKIDLRENERMLYNTLFMNIAMLQMRFGMLRNAFANRSFSPIYRVLIKYFESDQNPYSAVNFLKLLSHTPDDLTYEVIAELKYEWAERIDEFEKDNDENYREDDKYIEIYKETKAMQEQQKICKMRQCESFSNDVSDYETEYYD